MPCRSILPTRHSRARSSSGERSGWRAECSGFGRSDVGYVTMGSPDEATYYVVECGAAWHGTPRPSRLANKASRHLGAETADTCGEALIT
jgi:hypothetical protein